MRSREYNNYQFLPFFNLDYSVDIISKLLKFGVVILDIITEGTVSQIFFIQVQVLFCM